MVATGSNTSRRGFLSTMVTGMLAIMSAMLAAVLARFASPRAQGAEVVWTALAPLERIPDHTFRAFRVRVPRQHGWMREQVERLVYARRTAEAVLVLGSRCTHLGCAVRWRADVESFHCPCHGGVYDRQGAVVAGPPPASLARFETRTTEGVVEVRAT